MIVVKNISYEKIRDKKKFRRKGKINDKRA